MKSKKAICILIAAALCGCSSVNSSDEINNDLILRENSGIYSQLKVNTLSNTVKDNKPARINYPEQKAIWLSYIDLNTLLYNKSENDFISEFDTVCLNCKSLGINTLYIHCRAFGDAFYNSDLFQKTKTFGSIEYDPLSIMIKKAHEYELSVHAWINPFRCETAQYLDNADNSLIITKWYLNGDDRLKYVSSDDHYWLNPAYEEVRVLICEGIKEIIEHYDVDGIHFDDYFYPIDDEAFDSQAFSESGEADLKKWRTQNIDMLVSSAYKTIKNYDKKILFGISPQGNIQNNYKHMYADVAKWCSESGYVDYIVPQIYFGFENSVLPFEQCADDWNSLIKNRGVSLVIGLGVYKIYSEDEFIKKTDILALQIARSKKLSNYSGYAYYNYISLFPSDSDKTITASEQIDNIKKTGGI